MAACQRKRLRFLRFSFMQRTQRQRLRLNGNRALIVSAVRPSYFHAGFHVRSRLVAYITTLSQHTDLVLSGKTITSMIFCVSKLLNPVRTVSCLALIFVAFCLQQDEVAELTGPILSSRTITRYTPSSQPPVSAWLWSRRPKVRSAAISAPCLKTRTQ